jgi:RHS repeat-associated protein
MTIKKPFATAMLALALAIGAQPTAAEPNRTFTYDRAGNTLSDSRSYTATYHLRGQLATITKAGITTTYTYNAKGQRVRKASSRGPAYTVTFVYDKEGHLLGEYDHTGEALREYVWLRDTPMVVFTPDPANPPGDPLVYFIHTDHLNTPRVVIDRNNVVRWRWISEPFGTTAPETNPSGLGDFTFNLRFPGQYADQESGLFYNYRRNYDKETGRYRESDPIGLQGGINTYAYVDGNPLGLVDPNGLDRWGPDPVFDLANEERRSTAQ